MKLQTVFQAGNSPYAIVIPTDVAKEVKLKKGQKVIVNSVDEDTIVIKKASKNGIKAKPATAEFEKWMKRFFDENGEALDELAVR